MSSRVVIKDKKPTGSYSRMATAIQQVAGKIDTVPDGLYDQKVTVKTGGLSVTNDDLDIEFDIPFDDDTEANEAEIIIYNMTDATISTIRKGAALTVSAGYGSDVGVIFSGYVSKKKTYFEDGDKITQIYAIDNNGKKEKELSIAYGSGTKASTILKGLIAKTGLPLAEFNIRRDHTYKDKVNIDGGLMDNIRKYAEICGVSAYICKSKVYVCNLASSYNVFKMSADTGLLSVSEYEEESTAEEYTETLTGVNAEMLLQNRVQTGCVINVSSRNIKGDFLVKEGSHSYDGDTFITKVKAVALSCIK